MLANWWKALKICTSVCVQLFMFLLLILVVVSWLIHLIASRETEWISEILSGSWRF